MSLSSTIDASTIAKPTAGLLVYNLATAGSSPAKVTPGYYYHNGSSWSRMANASSGGSNNSSMGGYS